MVIKMALRKERYKKSSFDSIKFGFEELILQRYS